MEKNCIDRKALRYNFLKKIIIRFDYDGMDDTELDQVISSISIELKKHDYTSRTVEMEKEMQFEFNDPESGDYAELYGKKVREQKVFVFHNENPQIRLSISSSSACITIEETKYVDCLKYCDVLWKVMLIISEPEKVPFFMFKRFGLRKINQCFLMDINHLNEYFEPSHYHVFRLSLIHIFADMIVSGEKEGPVNPTPKNVGLIAAGTNSVCFDEAVSTLMGFDYHKIPSIVRARKSKGVLPLVREDEEAPVSYTHLSVKRFRSSIRAQRL